MIRTSTPAQYNATAHVWDFPSGAKIYFGSMQYTKDRTNYQGKAYDFIGFDELTHFEWEEYSYMMSRNRPTGPGTRVYMRATTNPGGIGHGWVKARFITPAPPGTPIVETVTVRLPDGTDQQMERARVFIPSSVFDNPALLANDPGYLASLASLPEAEKQALLYGSWDSFSGQVFTEWRNDPAHYQDQRWTHVIAPFAIPRHWKIYRGYDFGFSKPFSVGWYAADEEGRLYRIKELYGCTGSPNEGLRIDPVEQAQRIREAEQNDPMLKGRTMLFDEAAPFSGGWLTPPSLMRAEARASRAMMERSPHFFCTGSPGTTPGRFFPACCRWCWSRRTMSRCTATPGGASSSRGPESKACSGIRSSGAVWGDAIRPMNLLMLYWEPGVDDIQASPHFFSLSMENTKQLENRWPQLKGHSASVLDVPRFLHDGGLDTEKKAWWWTGTTKSRTRPDAPCSTTASSATVWCSTPARTTRPLPGGASTTTGSIPSCSTRCLWKRTARRALAISM